MLLERREYKPELLREGGDLQPGGVGHGRRVAGGGGLVSHQHQPVVQCIITLLVGRVRDQAGGRRRERRQDVEGDDYDGRSNHFDRSHLDLVDSFIVYLLKNYIILILE